MLLGTTHQGRAHEGGREFHIEFLLFNNLFILYEFPIILFSVFINIVFLLMS